MVSWVPPGITKPLQRTKAYQFFCADFLAGAARPLR
jgi:hypothetical protein